VAVLSSGFLCHRAGNALFFIGFCANMATVSITTSAATIFEQQLLEARILRRVNAAAANQEPRRVLAVLCAEIAKALGADSAAFGRLNPSGNALEIIAEYRQNGNSAIGVELPLSGNDITPQVMRERRAVVIEDAQNDPKFGKNRDSAKAFGIKSMMIVPLIADETVLGTLGLDSHTSRTFSIADQQLAMNVVQAAIPALKQTHIIEALRHELHEREQAEIALRHSQNRFINLVNNLECVVSEGEIVGDQARLTFVSGYVETIFGYTPEWLYSQPNWHTLAIHPEDQNHVLANLHQAFATQQPFDLEYRVCHKNGAVLWIRNQISMEFVGETMLWRGLTTDITHLKKQQLLEQDRNRVLAMIASGATLTDTLHTIAGLLYRQFGLPCGISSYQAANTMLLAQVGIPQTALADMQHIQLNHHATTMRQTLKNGAAYGFELAQTEIFDKDLCQHLQDAGYRFATLLPMNLASGQTRGGLVFFSPEPFAHTNDPRIHSGCDLAAIAIERQRLLASLEHQALHDPLTGLPNRAFYTAHLEQCIAKALRNQSGFALVQIDLNSFKSLNDTHGHAYGDHVLCQVAQTLLRAVRKSDLVARLGGDEFCVIAQDIHSHSDAAVLCQLLEQALVGLDLEPQAQVSAAIGYALYPSDAEQPDTLYSHADRAMYQRKHSGRQAHARV
jgi:diguanylate cyclase (GGDEF)-like protein/PAS domain S-box-containing protein